MARTVHLIRHGQSTFNAQMSLTGIDPMLYDAPLSDLGQQQVSKLRHQMADVPVDLVVTSPFTRAIQTSMAAFGHRDLPVVVESIHREHLAASCDVGRSPDELVSDFPHLTFDHLDDPWWHSQDGHDASEKPFAIEPQDILMDRVKRFRGWIASRPEEHIAVVGHGTFFFMVMDRFLNNAEVHTLEF